MAKCSVRSRHSTAMVKITSFVSAFHLFTVCGAVTLATPKTTQVTVGEQVLFHVNIQGGDSYDVTFHSKNPNTLIAVWTINNTVNLKSAHLLYVGRVQWNESGSVVLYNVQVKDSRKYKIEINYQSTGLKNNDEASFELRVFEPVSQLAVKIIDDCTTPNIILNCSTSKGTNVTFHWRKESLSGAIDSAFNGTQLVIDLGNEEEQQVYRCIAENPVSNAKSDPVRPEPCHRNKNGLFWIILLGLIPAVLVWVYYSIISTKAGRATQEHSEHPDALSNGFVEPTYITLLNPRRTSE
ncbi:hepatocyte cell adhesion molecule-like [Carcharodon carcharias]|uniref:hepatocyte cell adhesion molecule-like n=1 Tax=Carcharodon carcharias TaxID=13397 RepID=UPI001B7E272E|nr:hepatocyte cell adhesion molecule-like [Carcharodon carcharias]